MFPQTQLPTLRRIHVHSGTLTITPFAVEKMITEIDFFLSEWAPRSTETTHKKLI